jgi:tetratricopeptide (TPR) repeat protein
MTDDPYARCGCRIGHRIPKDLAITICNLQIVSCELQELVCELQELFVIMAAFLHDVPPIVKDARFRASRTLVTRGEADQAIETFALLLGECRRAYASEESDDAAPSKKQKLNDQVAAKNRDDEQVRDDERDVDDIRSAPAYYEYGNALFRAAVHATSVEEAPIISTEAVDALPAPEAKIKPNDGGVAEDDDENDSNQDDVKLALEMMETAYAIMDNYYFHNDSKANQLYRGYVGEEIPRVLTGIGDVLSFLRRHADAADAYARALQYRQELVAAFEEKDKHSLRFLESRRKVVEATVLLAEELLACPADQDVVTTETKVTIVTAAERVDYARGYYNQARDELQEVVFLLGVLVSESSKHMASVPDPLQEEKENICFVATLVMNVGTMLAEIDDADATSAAATASPSEEGKPKSVS